MFPRAVLFDLDGTLADTLRLCLDAFRAAIEPLTGRAITDEEILATFGPSEEGTVKVMVPHAPEQCLEDYLSHYEAMHHTVPAPFHGIRELLAELRERGVRLALVTGKGPMSTEISLRQFELQDVFEVVETGSPAGPRKEEAIRDVLARWSLRPDEVIYVGDAPSDIRASHAVGVRIVAAAWASTVNVEALRRLGPDWLAFSVSGLAEILLHT